MSRSDALGVPERGRPRAGRIVRPPWTTTTVGALWLGGAAIAVAAPLALGYAADELPPALATALVALAPLVLGSLVAARRPRHPAGPLLASAGVALIATSIPAAHAAPAFAGGWMLLYLPLALLLLVIPDGRSASPFWTLVGWMLTGVVGMFMSVCALQVWVPAGNDLLEVIGVALLAGFLILLLLCAAAPIARYRRSSEEERLRLRWVYLAGTTLPITLLLCWASYALIGTPDLVGLGLLLMFLGIPAGVTIGLLRPTLLDIDRAAVATMTTVSLSVVSLAVISVAGAAAGLALVQWSPIAAIATVVALTVCAALAYRVVRHGFDLLLYPERVRAVAALRQLTMRVDEGTAQPEEITAVLRAALRDPGLRIGYRRIADRSLVGVDGGPMTESPLCLPIRLRGEEIGAILPSPDRVKRPPAEIARGAARLVDIARARAELSHAMGEVEASRARILLAGYEERRRLERDLHDGAQQRLVALGMRLRVLQRTAVPGPALADSLDAAVAELGTAVAELRRIAHGMRPSALDDGLAPALAELVRLVPTSIDLDVHAPELPDAVATTAYYVVNEAVVNALRHAGASRIRVRVTADDQLLRIRVDDDGRGGALRRPTGGLTGLADRVSAVGGRLTVDSPSGRGTVVEALLPCAS